jgi:hypothetical protein
VSSPFEHHSDDLNFGGLEPAAVAPEQPGPAYLDFVAAAHAGTSPQLVRAIDPLLLLALARIAAEIFLACTAPKAKLKLARMKVFPHGFLANRIQKQIAARLEATVPDSAARQHMASVYLQYAIDNPGRLDGLFAEG